MELEALISQRFGASSVAAETFFGEQGDGIVGCAAAMAARFHEGATLLVFGSGARATDAQHNAVEYLHPVLPGCRALPAVGLLADAWAGAAQAPEDVFAHQVRVLGRAKDIALGFGVVPPEPALERGLNAARESGLLTVALLSGIAPAGEIAEHQFSVGTDDPLVAQEVHLTAYHVLWELVHLILNHRGMRQVPGA